MTRVQRGRNLKVERRRKEQEAEDALEVLNLRLPPRPDDKNRRPPVPEPHELTDFHDEELMELMTEITRWVDYLGVELAIAEIHERGAQKVLDFAEASALIKNWGGGRDDSVTVAKALRRMDPDVEECEDALHGWYARRKLLNAMYEAAERDAALCSRELTRRTEMADNRRRVDRSSA